MYKRIIKPSNLVKGIKNFDEWLNLATCKKDLECCLKAFEDDELYEYCVLIKEKIDNYGKA